MAALLRGNGGATGAHGVSFIRLAFGRQLAADHHGHDGMHLRVSLGPRFDVDASLGALQQEIGPLLLHGAKLRAGGLTVRDADSPAYGDGVTRQWVRQLGSTLLRLPGVFQESDPGPAVSATPAPTCTPAPTPPPATTAVKTPPNATSMRALALVALAKHRFARSGGGGGHGPQELAVLLLSPLSEPVDGSAAAKHLVGAGRAIGMSLARGQPLGQLLAPHTCKLLVGRADLVDWHDLEAVLPAGRFGALAACMDGGLSCAVREARFEEFKVWMDVFPGDAMAFEVPSREARRHDALAAGGGAAGPIGRERSALVEAGAGASVTEDTVADFAAASGLPPRLPPAWPARARGLRLPCLAARVVCA